MFQVKKQLESQQISTLENQMHEVKKRLDTQQETLKKLDERVERNEANSRKNNLRIYGFKQAKEGIEFNTEPLQLIKNCS